jgi:hypothetical protein
VQPFYLALLGHIIRLAGAAVKRACPLILQLLLPRVNLIGVNLVALGELVDRRLLARRSREIFAFSAASIFRRVLFVIVCSA